MRRRPVRLFLGIAPETGAKIAETPKWELWAVSRTKMNWWLHGEVEWLGLKLIALSPREDKANISLGLSVDRYARTDDFAFLHDKLPELIPWLEGWREKLSLQRANNLG